MKKKIETKRDIKEILDTYDNILINSKEIPSLKNKSIIRVNTIEGEVAAQMLLKKPIYYYMDSISCTFYIYNDDSIIIYIYKENQSAIPEIERKIEEEGSDKGIDHKLLDDIEKTTTIILNDLKSVRVSPIRKKK